MSNVRVPNSIEARDVGMIGAVELVKNKATKEMFEKLTITVKQLAEELEN